MPVTNAVHEISSNDLIRKVTQFKRKVIDLRIKRQRPGEKRITYKISKFVKFDS